MRQVFNEAWEADQLGKMSFELPINLLVQRTSSFSRTLVHSGSDGTQDSPILQVGLLLLPFGVHDPLFWSLLCTRDHVLSGSAKKAGSQNT